MEAQESKAEFNVWWQKKKYVHTVKCSKCDLELTETLYGHVRWLFLTRPHIQSIAILISSTGPVIPEMLRHHMAARCCCHYHWDEAAGPLPPAFSGGEHQVCSNFLPYISNIFTLNCYTEMFKWLQTESLREAWQTTTNPWIAFNILCSCCCSRWETILIQVGLCSVGLVQSRAESVIIDISFFWLS